MLTKNLLNSLKYQWNADIQLENGQEVNIWWTAWAMSKNTNIKILNVYSNIPKAKIK